MKTLNENMISVIIPMYNSQVTIRRCLDSVLTQTYDKQEYEIIVVNDGSKDNSQKIVEDYILSNENKNFNIRLINQDNGGVSKARNTGLKNCNGGYIAFLDSDDEWKENKIYVQMRLITDVNNKIDFLGTAFSALHFKNHSDNHLLKIDFQKLIFKNYFQPSTVVMKRKVLDEIGLFNETQKYAEEGNYFLRVSRSFNCYFLNEILINYGDGKSGFGTSGLSANLKEMERGELKNLKFVYNQKWISFPMFCLASVFSILKYLRRIIIVNMRT